MGFNKTIAIIPARGGSKGLKGKNIRDFCGKPLISYTIEAALECDDIDRVIVSTDDNDFAEISKKYNAEVPFMRPEELATDNASSISVIFHTLEWLKINEKFDPNYIVLLQPTSPLRTTNDISKAFEVMKMNNARSVVSVCKSNHNPLLSNTLPENSNMGNFILKDYLNKRRQDLPDYYQLNGAIYLSEVKYLYEINGFFGKETYAYIMSQEHSIDIDTEIDFELASLLYKKLF